MPNKPLTKLQQRVLAVIDDAKAGEISGLSIATWLLKRRYDSGIKTVLRSLEARGLIVMTRHDDGGLFPDRMKATYRRY